MTLYHGVGIPFIVQEFLSTFLDTSLTDPKVIKENIINKFDEKEFDFVYLKSSSSSTACPTCSICSCSVCSSSSSECIFLGKLKEINKEDILKLIKDTENVENVENVEKDTQIKEIPLLSKLGYDKERYISLLFMEGENTLIL